MAKSFLAVVIVIVTCSSIPATGEKPRTAIVGGRAVSSPLGMLTPTPAPVSAGAGVAAVMGLVGAPIDLVYVLRGGGTTDFWQYDISQNEWRTLPGTPAAVGDGGGIVEIASYTFCTQGASHFALAALGGGNTNAFWIFDINAATWCAGPPTPALVGSGGAIAQLQRLGEVYALRGAGTSEFWKFGTNGQWVRLADTPGPVNSGGALVGVNHGTASQRDVLYALEGGGSTALWKYDVATDTWSHQSDVPAPVGPGGAIASPNVGGDPEGTLDILQGGGSSMVWALNVSANAWKMIDVAPGPVTAGGASSSQFNGCDFALLGGSSSQFFSTGLRDCQAVARQPAFSLSFDQPLITATAGTKVAATLNVLRAAGFTGSVTVTPPDTPPRGIRILLEQVAITGDRVRFKLKVKGSAQSGTYPLVFVATGASGETHTATLTLAVQ